MGGSAVTWLLRTLPLFATASCFHIETEPWPSNGDVGPLADAMRVTDARGGEEEREREEREKKEREDRETKERNEREEREKQAEREREEKEKRERHKREEAEKQGEREREREAAIERQTGGGGRGREEGVAKADKEDDNQNENEKEQEKDGGKDRDRENDKAKDEKKEEEEQKRVADVCVVQYDDMNTKRSAFGGQEKQDSGEERAFFKQRNQEMCARDEKCAYVFVNGQTDWPKGPDWPAMPPYWAKVKVAQTRLDDACRSILWLDVDAVMHFNQPVSAWVKGMLGEKHFAGGHDGFGVFNAGVWAVRNSDQGKKIMNAWMSLYDGRKWSNDEESGKWECKDQGKECEWGGDDYEQGAFIKKVIYEFKEDIALYEGRALASRSPCNDAGEDVRHFYGSPGVTAKRMREYVEAVKSNQVKECRPDPGFCIQKGKQMCGFTIEGGPGQKCSSQCQENYCNGC